MFLWNHAGRARRARLSLLRGSLPSLARLAPLLSFLIRIRDLSTAQIEVADREVVDDGRVGVEMMQTNVARVYAASKKAENDYRDYPTFLRIAISVAR